MSDKHPDTRRRSDGTKPPPPDFVIVGAPKCGTTAIYKTLQQHPQLFLPSIKEPHFFASEFMNGRAVETVAAYDRLFDRAPHSQLRGEASVMYLSSTRAIPALIGRRPDVKIIACIRDPVEMFVSWHNQCLKSLDEKIADPEVAWRTQEARAREQQLSGTRPALEMLHYRSICSVDAQLARMARQVPEKQRLILVYDDIVQKPREAYKRIIDFLGVTDDQRAEFLRENTFARPRSMMRARAARAVQTYPLLKKLRLTLKPFLHRHGIHLVERFFQSNLVEVGKPRLSEEFRRELRSEFSADVGIVENLIGRDLSAWRTGEAALAKNA